MVEKTSSTSTLQSEGSIESGDRYRTPDGTVWMVLEAVNDQATAELGMPTAWLRDVAAHGCERWMSLSELSARLSDDWEVVQ